MFINMVKAGDDGLRNINLMSCSGARRFDGEASLAECLSCLDKVWPYMLPPERCVYKQMGEANLRSVCTQQIVMIGYYIEIDVPVIIELLAG